MENISKNISKTRVLLLIIAIALIIRLFGITQPLYDGEADNANIYGYFNAEYYSLYKEFSQETYESYFSETNMPPTRPHHPPLSMLIFSLFTFIFGSSTMAFRLVSIIFGILSIYLIYLLAKLVYDEKTAVYSASIATIAFWHILLSIQVNQHSSLIVFLSLAIFYFFIKYEKTAKNGYLVLSSISFALALLTTYLALLVLFALFIYIILRLRSIKKILLAAIPYLLYSLVIFSLFPLISYLTNPAIFLRTIKAASSIVTLIPNPRLFVILLVWGGPLLVFLFVFSLIRYEKEGLLFIITILSISLAAFFTKSYASLDRYLMVIVPSLCILAGNTLAKIKFRKKQAFTGIIVFAAFYLFLLMLNLKKTNYLPRDLSMYIKKAISLDWNFFFPITGPAGPVFGLSFDSIIISIALSFIFFIFALFFIKNKKIFTTLLVSFLAVSLAFNTILVQEFLFSTAHPDFNKVRYELFDYYKKNNFTGNLYTNDLASWYYLGKKFNDFHLLSDISMEKLDSLIKKEHGTILITQFPRMATDGRLWEIISQCAKLKEFSSKNEIIGYVFSCE